MSRLKVAFAQIDFKPTLIYNQIDLLIEPYGDESTSISKFTYNGSQRLKANLKSDYISYIKLKILSILRKAIQLNINLLVFPEYSIPVAILYDIVNAIHNTSLTVVAGTHIITRPNCKLPNNYPSSDSLIGCAICPVLNSDGLAAYTLKTHKAAPEVNSIRIPKNKDSIANTFNMGKYELQIKICIDAITAESASSGENDKRILAITSWSKNIEPFQALAILSKYNDIPVIYANCASTGGSMISGAFSKYNDHWFADGMKTKPISKGVECLVSATINLEQLHSAVGTVNTEEAIVIDDVVNIFYGQDEIQKDLMRLIDDYLSNLKNNTLDAIRNKCNDPILALKLRYLQIINEQGVLENFVANKTLDYLKINSVSFECFKYQQSQQALSTIASHMQQAKSEEKFYDNMAKLSERLNAFKNAPQTQTNVLDDDNLFSGRDGDVSALSQFFNSNNNVYLLHGLRGIGKTKLVRNVGSKVLPTSSPWEIKYLELEKGIGFELLFDQLSYVLNLSYIEQSGKDVTSIVSKIFEMVEQMPPTALIIDDIHNCTEVNGIFADKKLKQFVLTFLELTASSKKLKLVITSNRRITDIEKLGIIPIEISRLNDLDIRHIINYCYRKMTNSTRAIEISDKVINIVYGNPLAAILVAQLIDENKLQEFETQGDLLKRFQERLIKNLLGEVKLSAEEEELMRLLSATKSKIDINFIQKKYSHLISSIDTLSNRFLLEKGNGYIKIHPLFKEYYYELLGIKERTNFHKLFTDYYEDIISHQKKLKMAINPEFISNVIYHSAGSMQIDKLKQYKSKYVEEVKPIADRLYKDKNYADAVYYYRMIFDTVGEHRTDVLIRMAQCYVFCSDLINGELFFNQATLANQRGAYLWAQYSIALSSKRVYIKRAIECAECAKEIYFKYNNNFKWELAKIKFAQARAYRFDKSSGTISKLYEEACKLDETNSYYLCMYAIHLYDCGDMPNAINKYNEAKIIEPKSSFVKRLEPKFTEQVGEESPSEDEELDLEEDFEEIS